MGTPYFAVPSLEKIIQSSHQVVAVVTAPDRPANRGMKLQFSAVKTCALEYNIPILQPEKLRDPQFLQALQSYEADLFVVVAFRMLPELVWNMPRLGSVNLHGSLLPKYRGAAPINWAVIHGEKETGVSTFLLQHEIDTGNILMQESFAIHEKDTAGMVHDKMMHIGADVLLKTIDAIANNTIIPTPQPITGNWPHAPKLTKETGNIDWLKPAQHIVNLIRGLQPLPAAYTRIQGSIYKIHEASIIVSDTTAAAGMLCTDNKSYIHIKAADAWVSINVVQAEGKKAMRCDEYLRGFKFKELSFSIL